MTDDERWIYDNAYKVFPAAFVVAIHHPVIAPNVFNADLMVDGKFIIGCYSNQSHDKAISNLRRRMTRTYPQLIDQSTRSVTCDECGSIFQETEADAVLSVKTQSVVGCVCPDCGWVITYPVKETCGDEG